MTAWAMTGRGVLLLIWIGLVVMANRAEGSLGFRLIDGRLKVTEPVAARSMRALHAPDV
jgi:hypothetical protein